MDDRETVGKNVSKQYCKLFSGGQYASIHQVRFYSVASRLNIVTSKHGTLFCTLRVKYKAGGFQQDGDRPGALSGERLVTPPPHIEQERNGNSR